MTQRFLTRCLVISVLAFPVAGFAQNQPVDAGYQDLIEVTEVLIDVLATDRSGNVLTGLGKEDFIVEENGQPVNVTGVSFYTTRYGLEGDVPAEDGAIPSSRYFVFFFHDQSRTGDQLSSRLIRQQLDASRQSQRWVEEEMLPSDWIAVVSYDVKLKVHQDFTQDRYAITEAIQNAVRRKDPEKAMGRRGREIPPSGIPSLLRELPQGKELRKQTTRVYDGIRLVAEATGYVVGRKNLMLFSIGFGEFRVNSLIPQADPRYYPQMVEALNDHNVAVYPIDIMPREIEHSQSSFLAQLANETGGRFYENFVNFITPLQQISEENAGYYLLSYQAEHPAADSGFQEVEVRARDKSVNVRARKGYRFGLERDS